MIFNAGLISPTTLPKSASFNGTAVSTNVFHSAYILREGGSFSGFASNADITAPTSWTDLLDWTLTEAHMLTFLGYYNYLFELNYPGSISTGYYIRSRILIDGTAICDGYIQGTGILNSAYLRFPPVFTDQYIANSSIKVQVCIQGANTGLDGTSYLKVDGMVLSPVRYL